MEAVKKRSRNRETEIKRLEIKSRGRFQRTRKNLEKSREIT